MFRFVQRQQDCYKFAQQKKSMRAEASTTDFRSAKSPFLYSVTDDQLERKRISGSGNLNLQVRNHPFSLIVMTG